MKTKKILIPVFGMVLSMTSFSAYSDENSYLGFNVEKLDVKGSEYGITIDLGTAYALSAKYGKELNSNFAVEGKVAVGISSSSKTYGGKDFGEAVEADPSLKYYGSALLVGNLPVNDDFKIYAKIGLSYLSVELESSYTEYNWSGDIVDFEKESESDSKIKPSYYLGAEYKIQPDMGLNLEYGQLFSGWDGLKASSLNLGITKYF